MPRNDVLPAPSAATAGSPPLRCYRWSCSMANASVCPKCGTPSRAYWFCAACNTVNPTRLILGLLVEVGLAVVGITGLVIARFWLWRYVSYGLLGLGLLGGLADLVTFLQMRRRGSGAAPPKPPRPKFRW